MTTPHDGPYPGPYARRDAHGAPPPVPGVYNPYREPITPRSSGLPPTPPTPAREPRPPLLLVALGLLALGALPWLVLGLALTFLPLNVQGAIDEGQLAGTPLETWSVQEITDVVRTGAMVTLALAVAHLVLVGLTFRGSRAARTALAALTIGFLLGLAFLTATSGSMVFAVLLVVPLIGTGLLLSRAVSAWFAGPRAGM
ncbi:hypothetical protein SAMN05443637_11970 [Pseudonocardia thermophila]|uniref:Uncharacterized protein n=1 Tax=Pseudonocardia thermophila TaxID=1848 RepID=A0A1M6Y9S7_PSETH|nr:hypothetical protein [Pseudonocardia thermophila]SHL14903.1 hypothetical protein SAMN05443637_11970 [Pseudonocardia thermophila]